MSFIDGLGHRLRVLFAGQRYADEQAREIGAHLALDALATRDFDADAERAARRRFGNVTFHRESMREASVITWLDRTRRNITFAWRGMRRAPGLSIAVVITVALAVGFNAAIASLLDRVLLRTPSGVARVDQLRRSYFRADHDVTGHGGRIADVFSYVWYAAARAALPTGDVIAFTPPDSELIAEGIGARVSLTSDNYFSVLGVRPTAGRVFGGSDSAVASSSHVMVVSERLWRSKLGGATPIGRVVHIDGNPYTIVGVVPADFSGLDNDGVDAWVPYNTLGDYDEPGSHWYSKDAGYYFSVVARVRSDNEANILATKATIAIRDLNSARYRHPDAVTGLVTGPLNEARGPGERSEGLTLATEMAGVSIIVLLIGGANVATLLSVRTRRRNREIAVRRALGASQWQIHEQIITESLLVAAMGGVAAFVVASWGGRVFGTLLFPAVHWATGALNLRIAACAVVVVFLIGLVGGVAPIATTAGRQASGRLAQSGGSMRRSRLATWLVAVQAAFSVTLLVGAGLFVRSLQNVESIDLGYDTHLMVLAPLPLETRNLDSAGPFVSAALAALASDHRVAAAALSSNGPMTGFSMAATFRQDGEPVTWKAENFLTFTSVAGDYFSASGLHLIVGRTFDATDRRGSTPVMIVNETMAHQLWNRANPVGECLVFTKSSNPCVRVVGVVTDTHRSGIIAAAAPQYYRPLDQDRDAVFGLYLIGRARGQDVAAAKQAMTAAIAMGFPGRKLPRIRTLAEKLEPQMRRWRLAAGLFTTFGALALLISAIGIFSVVALGVGERRREIGVRVALGGQAVRIIDALVAETLVVIGVGVLGGIGAAALLGRLVAALLFGITTTDVGVMAGAAAILLATALVASALPAWRATRADPMAALRAD